MWRRRHTPARDQRIAKSRCGNPLGRGAAVARAGVRLARAGRVPDRAVDVTTRPTLVPLHFLLALALHAQLATPADSARLRADSPSWASVLAFDEVRVDADTSKLVAARPFTVWLRWSFLARVSSPQAWDAGARGSFDLAEVDCGRGATRTLSSIAYGRDGQPVIAASYEDANAAWRVARAETVAGMLTAELCGMAGAKR